MISDKHLSRIFEAMRMEIQELKVASKIAAQNGMYESRAALCNRAAGLRRALEILGPPCEIRMPARAAWLRQTGAGER